MTFSIHYQHKTEPQLETRVMSTAHCPNSSGVDLHEYWTVFIDALFSEWHINANKVTAIVVATSCTELIQVLAGKNFVLIPCLMYSLQVSSPNSASRSFLFCFGFSYLGPNLTLILSPLNRNVLHFCCPSLMFTLCFRNVGDCLDLYIDILLHWHHCVCRNQSFR